MTEAKYRRRCAGCDQWIEAGTLMKLGTDGRWQHRECPLPPPERAEPVPACPDALPRAAGRPVPQWPRADYAQIARDGAGMIREELGWTAADADGGQRRQAAAQARVSRAQSGHYDEPPPADHQSRRSG